MSDRDRYTTYSFIRKVLRLAEMILRFIFIILKIIEAYLDLN